MTTNYHSWEFTRRFHFNAFRNRDYRPIECIKNAILEIENKHQEDSITAAEGAIILIELIPPSLNNYEGSTGGLKKFIHGAIKRLVPIIEQTNTEESLREEWLKRMWAAIKCDEFSYIEPLTEYFGFLCARDIIASMVSDNLVKNLEEALKRDDERRILNLYIKASLSTLFAAARFLELRSLLDNHQLNTWEYRKWGVKSLIATRKINEALYYALRSEGSPSDKLDIVITCEKILLDAHRTEEAYKRFAFKANQAGSIEKTCKKIQKKYNKKWEEVVMDFKYYPTDGMYIDLTDE